MGTTDFSTKRWLRYIGWRRLRFLGFLMNSFSARGFGFTVEKLVCCLLFGFLLFFFYCYSKGLRSPVTGMKDASVSRNSFSPHSLVSSVLLPTCIRFKLTLQKWKSLWMTTYSLYLYLDIFSTSETAVWIFFFFF